MLTIVSFACQKCKGSKAWKPSGLKKWGLGSSSLTGIYIYAWRC